MINIAKLMKQHDGYKTAHSLDDCLGDGYLYSRNLVFSSIRDLATGHGLTFSAHVSDHWVKYQALPFFSLQDIFDKRRVPYADNVSVFRAILKQDPTIALPASFVLDSLKKNYIMHESAHFTGYRLITRLRKAEGAPKTAAEWFVSYCLLSEAFARVVERFAMFAADSDLHVLFLLLNSYCAYNADNKKCFDGAVAESNQRALFRLAMFIALYSNISAEPIQDILRQSFIDLSFTASSGNERSAELEGFFKIFTAISPAFREMTTRIYFRVYKCEKEFDAALTNMLESETRMKWIAGCFDLLTATLFDAMDSKRREMEFNAPAAALAQPA
jgi:hypothetical protein